MSKQLKNLLAQLNGLRDEARSLNEAGKVDEAEAKLEEMRALKKQIDVTQALEDEEIEDLENQRDESRSRERKKTVVNEMRSITKHIMGEDMTPEERAVIKTSDNAAVIPKQFINELEEIKKGYGALKGYCDVIPVTKNEGSKPVVDYDQNELAEIAEGADIVDGELVTTDITFKCIKIGLIQTLSSELVDDAEVEIEGIARTNFAEISVAKENKKIMKVVDDSATVVEASDYTALEDIMAKALPTVKTNLITLCNVEGYALLKNMKDKQGRSLNLITTVGSIEVFNGKPIVPFDSSLVTPTGDKTCIFYSLAMKEAVKFFDRKGATIARSTEAGFNNDTVKLRILERLDVKPGSKRSVKKIEL
ncbi:phage major capsid protein [Clostridium butyricum]|uniref:Phage major capsid protein, HK97 family n=1 Tax=Clostridium butyricum E4 str. BoNT E BL5262 TaxID=632245 RepID=C4IGS1_CLOBU|nr:phage major capsid protein [Clostridium butyricum]EDT74749.1 phage major capsid protein, HK97 family [Clostridium butyricum 5521]EEP53995.1 phage major capsid protein, HK97 family [Clostridium butyricum E4 str. BoNT E BL5262]NFL30489.1 phage major capsid protein [Clostridium butyricum]NFS19444.1 phage major capsid protein [Clostridium butyricum]